MAPVRPPEAPFHVEHPVPDPMTPEAFAAAAGVSRETLARLRRYDDVLIEWSARLNLVARSTLPDRWRRHYLDSAQLLALIPADARSLVDLGSGAGFPGLVLAALAAERGMEVLLVESVGKKAAFLAAAASAMGLTTVTTLNRRIESLDLPPPDVITARALAPLPRLLEYAAPLVGPRTVCLFQKGQDVENELTEATKSWNMLIERHASRTDPTAAILEIRSLRPKSARKGQKHAPAHSRNRQPKGGRG